MTQFFIPGQPQGKGRPRASVIRTAGRMVPRMHTPEKTRNFEQLVQLCWKSSGGQMLYPPVRAELVAVFEVPKSYTKTRRASCLDGETPCTVKPDLDNIVKAVLDALNGLAYRDDAHITQLAIRKIYGERAGVWVTLAQADGKGR